MDNKKVVMILMLLAVTLISGCTYAECVANCSESYAFGGYDNAAQCIAAECSSCDHDGGDANAPEFTAIGAGLALLGAGFIAYKKRKN